MEKDDGESCIDEATVNMQGHNWSDSDIQRTWFQPKQKSWDGEVSEKSFKVFYCWRNWFAKFERHSLTYWVVQGRFGVQEVFDTKSKRQDC